MKGVSNVIGFPCTTEKCLIRGQPLGTPNEWSPERGRVQAAVARLAPASKPSQAGGRQPGPECLHEDPPKSMPGRLRVIAGSHISMVEG